MNPLRCALLAVLCLMFQGCGSSSHSTTCTANCGVSPGGEFLYGSPADGMLNTFITAEIDPATGAFTSLSTTTPPILSSGGMAAVGSQFLYISVGAQIFGYAINSTSGLLSSLSGSPFNLPKGRSPQHLVGVAAGHFLYAADLAGGIDAFQVDSSTGKLTPINGSPFGAAISYDVATDTAGKFLYATDHADGEVFAYMIGPNGALTDVQGSPFPLPGGKSGNPVGIVNTGSFLYVALTSLNEVAAFSINGGDGSLTAVPGMPIAAGDAPTSLAAAGKFLYVVNAKDADISGYSIDSSSGALRTISGSPFFPKGSIATIATDPSGKYLFVSRTVGIFGSTINPTTGALTETNRGVSNDGSLWLVIVQTSSSVSQ